MKIDFLSDINKGYEEAMNYSVADRFVVKVLGYGFISLCALTFLNAFIKISEYYPSPFSWRVIEPAEAWGALILGFLTTIIPTLLRNKISNHYVWRLLITAALTMYAYLFVFIGGGSIEMHFIFFCMIALAVIYSDWRLGWIILVLTGLHHGILNYLAPTWVYFYGRNDFAVVAHAIPVLIAVAFTTILSENNKKSIADLQEARINLEKKVTERTAELEEVNRGLDKKVRERTAELEKLKNNLEQTVVERTKQLENNMEDIKKLNKHMVGRELRMVELKQEITRLKDQSG